MFYQRNEGRTRAAPKLVHNSIFFIVNHSFLPQTGRSSTKRQKGPAGPAPSDAVNRVGFLEDAAIEGRVGDGTDAATILNRLAGCNMYDVPTVLAVPAGTARGYGCTGRHDEHDSAQEHGAKASKQQHLFFHIEIFSFQPMGGP